MIPMINGVFKKVFGQEMPWRVHYVGGRNHAVLDSAVGNLTRLLVDRLDLASSVFTAVLGYLVHFCYVHIPLYPSSNTIVPTT